MSTGFFKPSAGGIKPPNGQNFEARAISSPAYAGRVAGANAQKDVAAALALSNKRAPQQSKNAFTKKEMMP